MNGTNHNGYSGGGGNYPLPARIARRIAGLHGYDKRAQVAYCQAEREIGCVDFLEAIGIGIEQSDKNRRTRARKIVEELQDKFVGW